MSTSLPPLLDGFGLSDEDDSFKETKQNNPTEQYYVKNNRSLLALSTLCLGVCDDDSTPLMDPDAAPWKLMKKKLIKPSNHGMCEEVKRRWSTFVSQSTSEGKKQRSP